MVLDSGLSELDPILAELAWEGRIGIGAGKSDKPKRRIAFSLPAETLVATTRPLRHRLLGRRLSQSGSGSFHLPLIA